VTRTLSPGHSRTMSARRRTDTRALHSPVSGVPADGPWSLGASDEAKARQPLEDRHTAALPDERPRYERLLVSPADAAELLSIGRTYLYELIRTGAIRSVRVGRLRRIPLAALRDYVERLSSSGSSSR